MADFTTPLMSEKRFYTLPDSLFTADGTDKGLVTVESTFPYKVGMMISLSSSTKGPTLFKIKRIISETQMYVGDKGTNIVTYSDVSTFTVAEGATVSFSEQERPVINLNEIQRQVYAEEPTIALRTFPVDALGRGFTVDNPFPIEEATNSKDYDKIYITRDLDKDITKVVYQKLGTTIRTFDLAYDIDKDLIEVDKTNGDS